MIPIYSAAFQSNNHLLFDTRSQESQTVVTDNRPEKECGMMSNPSSFPSNNGVSSTSMAQLKNFQTCLDLRKYKTQLCRNWMSNGTCAFAKTCVYAHGMTELQNVNDNTEAVSIFDQMGNQTKDAGNDGLACKRPRRRTRRGGNRGHKRSGHETQMTDNTSPRTTTTTAARPSRAVLVNGSADTQMRQQVFNPHGEDGVSFINNVINDIIAIETDDEDEDDEETPTVGQSQPSRGSTQQLSCTIDADARSSANRLTEPLAQNAASASASSDRQFQNVNTQLPDQQKFAPPQSLQAIVFRLEKLEMEASYLRQLLLQTCNLTSQAL
jgi:hypothetical protein